MRLSFASGILCAGLFAVSCVQRDYNTAETKAVTDTKTIVKNPDGTFTVTCDWGAVENNVTAEQINKNDVCKVTQVNPKAFNAFNIWRDGQGVEILDYPNGYDAKGDPTTSDDVFYVETKYFGDGKFKAVPTKGASVVQGVLQYPIQNGKQLKLKFSEVSVEVMSHQVAVQYCKDKGTRLPTIRELFDFCAAGVTGPNYGPDFRNGWYPSTGRCYGKDGKIHWSASVDSYYRGRAWQFGSDGGYASETIRHLGIGVVRCVGPAD
jgi:hypothetical protein